MAPNKVDNTPVCWPIKEFLKMTKRYGGHIIEQKLKDHHFYELSFEIKIPKNTILEDIDCVEKHEKGFFYCTCHWSMIEITQLD